MKKLLALIDFQNDFIDGSLGTIEAEKIVPSVIKKIQSYDKNNRVATMDTHFEYYMLTQEGWHLPIIHCIKGTKGWLLHKEAQVGYKKVFEKSTFGSLELAKFIKDERYDEVELIGVCTDICVVSNALLIKSWTPEIKIIVDAHCCAGVSPEKHLAALETMKSCQIQVVNE